MFGALPRIALPQAITPGSLAFYGRTLTLVCLPLALVGEAIPLVGAPLALIGDAVAAVSHGLPLPSLTLPLVDGLLALVEFLLPAFEIGRVRAVVLRRAFSQGWNHNPLIVNAAPELPRPRGAGRLRAGGRSGSRLEHALEPLEFGGSPEGHEQVADADHALRSGLGLEATIGAT